MGRPPFVRAKGVNRNLRGSPFVLAWSVAPRVASILRQDFGNARGASANLVLMPGELPRAGRRRADNPR